MPVTRTTERRESPRIPIGIWVEEQQGEATYYQRSANLSMGGIYLDGTLPHPVGTRVRLKLTLPDDPEPIGLDGEIVGGTIDGTPGMNVKFVALDEADGRRLAAFLGPRVA